MQAKKKLELEEYRPEEGDSDDDVEPNRRRRHSAGRDFYLSAKLEVLKLVTRLTKGLDDVSISEFPIGSKTTRGAPADGVLKVLCDGSPGMAPAHVLVPFQVIPCYLETNDNSGAPMHFYLRERDVHHGFQRCDLLICVGVTMTIDGCERISQVRIRLHD